MMTRREEKPNVFFLVPPFGAAVWWLMARNMARTMQGGTVSEASRKRQNKWFWIPMAAAYVLMFGITTYAYLK